MKKIFIDSAPLIYFLDNLEPYASIVNNYIASEFSSSQFYTSIITDIEVLTKPYQIKNYEARDIYLAFLKSLKFKKVALDEESVEVATRLRAKYKSLKTPDALQLASAII